MAAREWMDGWMDGLVVTVAVERITQEWGEEGRI